MKSFFSYHWVLAGVAGIFLFVAPHAFAATNVSSSATAHWAWNDSIGWIDFNPSGAGNVVVTPTQLEGYASSSAGQISFNCDATNPSGVSVCGTSSFKVTNDGVGNLGGWAWNDRFGWISFFWGNASANPSAAVTSMCSTYESRSYTPMCGVTIDGYGAFQGWAWNDTIGWIDFNCDNPEDNVCNNPMQFSVVTTWAATSTTGTLDSQTFDTGVANGAQLNSIMWKGVATSSTSVSFQFAVSSNSTGPWNYGAVYTPTGPGIPLPLTGYSSLTGRYFRYRVILTTDKSQTKTPEVDDVIVNWSP
jgi:hypothetical protein